MIFCFKILYILLVLQVDTGEPMDWATSQCSFDTDQEVPIGVLPDDQIGRFPWLGVIQHDFYLAGETRHAITTAILIHHSFAIAPAEDMAKIDHKAVYNNTHFILWHSETEKYSIDIQDYSLHPDYLEDLTYATIALVEILPQGETNVAHTAPVLPVTLPISGAGTFSNLYVVKMTDETGELKKEAWSVDYVNNKDCNQFYERSGLEWSKMTPTSQHCVVVNNTKEPCVWDGGAALITRQNWGYWTLLGFGTRGPGCGAPARFINVHAQLEWIDERISRIPSELLPEDRVTLVARSISPVEVIVYAADDRPPETEGQCERRDRGNVLFKEQTEITVNKNFAQGFYFVSVANIMSLSCAHLRLTSRARTSASVWIEHYCHRDMTGIMRPFDAKKLECFLYFKSTAYVEFRFQFSFRAMVEMTLYSKEDKQEIIQFKPSASSTTYSWYPTDQELLRWGCFVPWALYWYYM